MPRGARRPRPAPICCGRSGPTAVCINPTTWKTWLTGPGWRHCDGGGLVRRLAAPSARSRFSSSPSPLDSLRIATAEGLVMVGLTLEADQTDAQRRIDLAVQDFPSALFTRSRHRHPSAALPQLIIRPRPWVLGKTHFRPTRQPKTRAGGIQVVRSPKFSRRSAPQPRRRHQDGGR